jgi:hypothetical protein
MTESPDQMELAVLFEITRSESALGPDPAKLGAALQFSGGVSRSI